MIEQVFKEDLGKIEIFAREEIDGWDQLGDETTKFINDKPLQKNSEQNQESSEE